MPHARVALFGQVFALWLASALALAGESRDAAAGVPALSAQLTVETLSDGSLTVREGGQRIWTFRPLTNPAQRGAPLARTLTVAGRALVEVSIPVTGRPTRELWLSERRNPARDAAVRPLWHGLVGALDTDGEYRFEVSVSSEKITAFQTATTVTRCDGPAQLYPQEFDFELGQFVDSAVVTAAAHVPADLRVLPVETPGPYPVAQRPRAGFRFVAASDQAGANRDARKLTPPVALGDHDPASAWHGPTLASDITGGKVANLFFTARGPKSATITGIRVWPGKPGTEKPFVRPRQIVIALGPTPEQRFTAELPPEGQGPFWIALPHPAAGGCLTVVVASTYPTPPTLKGPPPALVLGELEIFSLIDNQDGSQALVEGLTSGLDCESWLQLLTEIRLHSTIEDTRALMRALSERTATASLAGQACLVRALASTTPVNAPDVLPAPEILADLATLFDAEVHPEAARGAHALLLRTGAASAPHLATQLANAPDAPSRARRAAALLAELHDATADRALLAALADQKTRLVAREALVRHARRLRSALLAELSAASLPAPTHADYLYLLAHALACPTTSASQSGCDENLAPANASTILQVVEHALLQADFAVRARAVTVLARLPHESARTRMVTLLSQLNDPVLRAIAIEALWPNLPLLKQDDPIRSMLVAALTERLSDTDPRVRELAARALARLSATDTGSAVLAATQRERWPFAQVGQAAALGTLCPEGSHAWFERALAYGGSDLRRVALGSIASCRHPRAHTILLDVVRSPHATPALRERAARLYPGTIAAGDDFVRASRAAALDEAVEQLLREANSDLALEDAALAALTALAELAPTRALARCLVLAETGRPLQRRTAIELLGILCDPTQGAAVLARASMLDDPWLANPARTAIAHCAGRLPSGQKQDPHTRTELPP